MQKTTGKTNYNKKIGHSLRFILILIGGIFSGEILVMLLINKFSPVTIFNTALLDSSLLLIPVFPLLYFFVFRPMEIQIAKREEAEESIRQTNSMHESMISNISDVIGIIDKDGTILYESPNIEKTYGWLPSDLVGTNCWLYVHPDDMEHSKQEFVRLMESGSPTKMFEFRFICKDGSYKFIELNASNHINNPDIGGILINYQDITERKKTEEQIEQGRLRLKMLFETMSEAIALNEMVFDESGRMVDYRILEVNDAFYNIADFNKGTAVVGSLASELYNMSHQVISEFWEEHKNSAETKYTEFLSPINNYWYFISTSPFKSNKFVTSFQNITKNKEAELAARTSEKAYRLLFQNLSVGYALHEIILDPNGKACDYRYLEINSAFEKLTGLKYESVVGKTVKEILPDIEPHWIETYGKVALQGKVIDFENYSKVFGKYYQINAYSPEPGKFATIFVDVTPSKKAEFEIKKSLEIQEKFQKHLTEVREEERAIISRDIHDQLGQSMTALKLDINWVQSKMSKGTEISAKLSGMEGIITSTIKDIQRISSELRPGILDDLGLAAAIEWYAEEFEKRSNLEVHLNLDEVQTIYELKNLAIFRVMQEALTNVIRHSKAKTVNISLHELNEHVVLDIEDDGIGIPIEKLKSTNSLGLMGMHDRIKQAGGTIDILCGDDSGTKIRICIPINENVSNTE